ncbi:MAG: RCC1 domain-containing protein [Actinomycetota bacterium]
MKRKAAHLSIFVLIATLAIAFNPAPAFASTATPIGTVDTWGSNGNGQLGVGSTTDFNVPVSVQSLSGVIAIAGGNAHTLALKSDGTVWAWGYGNDGELGNGGTSSSSVPVQVHNLSNVIAISAGGYHSLALKSDGTVWAWGGGGNGQLGNGATVNESTPVQVSNITHVIAIAAGYLHSVALTSAGLVDAWGYNNDGELGDGVTTSTDVPIQSRISGVIAIAAGSYHSLAVKTDGTVWDWGGGGNGQLGNGSSSNTTVPVQASGITNAVSVAGGAIFSLALKSDGTVWAWGDNSDGQLGNGTTTSSSVPVQVTGLNNAVVKIAAGAYHSVALLEDDTVWDWGDNSNGQLGNFSTTNSSVPIEANGLHSVVSVSAGSYYSVSLKIAAAGQGMSWGANGSGQLGDNNLNSSAVPVQVSGFSGAVQMAGGNVHSLGFKSDQIPWAWGSDQYFQLGNNSNTNSYVPVQVSNLSSVVSMSGGSAHTLAVAPDGTEWAWGGNSDGQLGDNSTLASSTPVQVNGLTHVMTTAAGWYHSLALKSDRTVWAWGGNGSGQLGNGTTTSSSVPVQVVQSSGVALSGLVAIAAGWYHSLALGSDGSIWAWGDDSVGQGGCVGNLNFPVTKAVQVANGNGVITGFVAIAANGDDNVGLKSDGTVWTWGSDQYGQLGNGQTAGAFATCNPVEVSNLTGVVAIAAGGYHDLALKSDGTVWAWGHNVAGQLGNNSTTDSNVPVQVSNISNAVSIGAGGEHSLAITTPAAPTIGSRFFYGSTQRNASVSLSGTAPANSDVAVLEGTNVLAHATANGSGSWSASISVDNGYHVLTAVGQDNANDEGPPSGATEFIELAPPSAPQNLTASGGNNSITLNWSPPATTSGSQILGYNLYRSTSSGTETFVRQIGTVPTYTDTGLTNGTTYYYKISAVTVAGEGAQSNEASAIAGAVPGAPTSLSATGGNQQVSLSWVAPASSGSSAITNYKIYRGSASGAETFLTEVGNVTGYTDTGLTNGTTYYYKVTALNSIGESSQSNEASATPVTVPGAPTGLSAAPGNSQVVLNWTAPASNGGSAITKYNIYRGTSSGAETFYVQINPVTSFTDTGLTNGTTYYYKLTSVNAVGESSFSNEASATPATVPSAPQSVSATSGNQQVLLSWSAPASNGGAAITNYNIYRSTSSGAETLLTQVGNVTSYTDIGLTNGTAYYYKIAAVNSAGTGLKSGEVSAVPATVPSAPQSVSATSGNQQVALSWSAPVSNGGAAITNYNIYRSTSSGAETLLTQVGNVTTFTDTGLTNGTTYYYKVSAVNVAGESALSSETSAVPATVASAPQNLTATAQTNSVALSWSAPASNGGSAITGYNVYRGLSSGSETLLASIGNQTSYNDTAISKGVTYYYTVAAVNGVGVGAQSAEASATTLNVPTAPQNLIATSGNAQVSLSWSAPASNGGSAVTGYNIYRSTSSGTETLLTQATSTSYQDTGLTNGTTYYYKVSAVNGVGEGSLSNEASAMPATLPGAPSGLSATSGNTQATLHWSAPSSNGGAAITNYNIYRSTSPGAETLLTQVGNVTSYTDSGLNNGAKYYYTVSAVNIVGEGPQSAETSVIPATVPSAPQSLSATPGNTTIGLSWAAPASNGGSAITNYNIYRGTTSGGETLLTQVGNVTSFDDTGLTNGTKYYYTVTALNVVGESGQSHEAYSTPFTIPGAPRNLSASPGDTQVSLSWAPPASDGGATITSYNIYRSTSSGAEIFVAQVASVTTYTDTGLTNGTTYYYEVTAQNAAGEGAISNETSVTPFTAPSAPLNLRANPGSIIGEIDLNWSAPISDGGLPIQGYDIYRGTSSGRETLLTQVPAETTSFADDFAKALFTTYYYKVSAFNAKEGPQSNEACSMAYPWISALGCGVL